MALNEKTRGLVNADVFGRMKPGAYFVNTARGEVVDYKALEAAVKEKGLRVALDVYAKEPATPTGDFVDALVELPGVYGTHHIGASTDQAQEAIAAETVHIIQTYLRDRPGAQRGQPEPQDAGDARPGRRATRTGPACSRTSSTGCARPASTSRRPRTSSSPTPKRPSRGSASRASRPPSVVAAIKSGNPHVLDVHVVAVH